jgi:hypothetical protein
MIVVDRRSCCERNPPIGSVDSSSPTVNDFNAMIRIVFLRPEAQRLSPDFAQKVVLGERWALIW